MSVIDFLDKEILNEEDINEIYKEMLENRGKYKDDVETIIGFLYIERDFREELLLKTTDDILIQMCTEAYIGEKINSFLSCYKLMFIRDYVSISLPSNEELMELAVKKDDSILDGLIELCQATLKGMDCYPNEVSIESLMEKNTLWGYYVYNRLFQLEDELGSIENEDIYKDSLKKIKIFLNRALIAIKTSKAKKEKEDKDYQKHRDYWNTRYFLASSSYIDRAKLSFLHVNASSGAKLKFAYDDDFSPLKEMYKETPLSFDVSNLPSNESYAKKLLTESSYNEVYAEAQELESAIYAYNEMIRYSDRDLSDSIDPITEFIKIHHPSLYESFDNLIQLKNKIRFELVEDPLKTPPKSFDNTSYFLPKTSAIFENELSNCNSKAEKEEIYFELLTLIYYAKLKFIAPFSYSPLPNNLENLAQNHDYKALESIEKKVSQLFPSMESGSAIDRIMEIFDYKLYDEIHQLSLKV